MYERAYGANYKDNMDIKDIAKEVRKMLKAELPGYKFSVTIDRFAGGQALNIVFVDVPAGTEILVKNEDEWKLQQYPVMYAPAFQAVIDQAHQIGNRFNYNGNEIQVDYFDVNYYCHPPRCGYDTPAEAIEKQQEAAVRDQVAKELAAA